MFQVLELDQTIWRGLGLGEEGREAQAKPWEIPAFHLLENWERPARGGKRQTEESFPLSLAQSIHQLSPTNSVSVILSRDLFSFLHIYTHTSEFTASTIATYKQDHIHTRTHSLSQPLFEGVICCHWYQPYCGLSRTVSHTVMSSSLSPSAKATMTLTSQFCTYTQS